MTVPICYQNNKKQCQNDKWTWKPKWMKSKYDPKVTWSCRGELSQSRISVLCMITDVWSRAHLDENTLFFFPQMLSVVVVVIITISISIC